LQYLLADVVGDYLKCSDQGGIYGVVGANLPHANSCHSFTVDKIKGRPMAAPFV
jgi:hypothetical protein